MRRIIIPLNAFNPKDVLTRGQRFYISRIHENGADGIEIRRELLSEQDKPLVSLKAKYLYTVYSAPIEIWTEQGELNEQELKAVIQETNELEADLLKLPLGHFKKSHSDVKKLSALMDKLSPRIKWLVENDQTSHGGKIESFIHFFEQALENSVEVGMTFDTGNWFYTGEDVFEAFQRLSPFVQYLHLKHVERKEDELVTCPLPLKETADWQKIVSAFPENMTVALEFPLELADIRRYAEYLNREKVGAQ